jgi:hypothetical protein
MKIRVVYAALVVGAVLAMGGCSTMIDEDTAKSALTEHQRDSVLAKSDFRGASYVDRTLKMSDQEKARAQSFESVVDSISN